ncbi:MAG: hypothetical protein F9K31_04465 [Dokdonella sp.]|nr:MAG: hypothetical protein F9K31_04465 [Dokdonella sp.]
MNDDIQRADPAYRRRTLLLLVLAAVVAAIALAFTQRWLYAQALVADPAVAARQLRAWIGMSTLLAGASLLVLAVHAWRQSRRAVRAARWPVPGVRVIRDTRVRRGAAVAPIVRWLRVCAMLCVVLAIAAIAIGWRIRTLPY